MKRITGTKLLFLGVAIVGLMVSGCASGTKPVAAKYSTGKHYFLRECGRCHNLVYPEEHRQTEWQHILAQKKGKVSLTSKQFAELENFIMFYAVK